MPIEKKHLLQCNKRRVSFQDRATGNSQTKKRWEDNITECTKLKLSEAVRCAENKRKWRALAHKSSVAHQQQPLLDR